MIGRLTFGGESFENVQLMFQSEQNYARFYRRQFRSHRPVGLEDILILTGCRMDIGERELVVRGIRLSSGAVSALPEPGRDYRILEAHFMPQAANNTNTEEQDNERNA